MKESFEMACTRADFITAEDFDAITSTLRYDEKAIFWIDLPVGVIRHNPAMWAFGT